MKERQKKFYIAMFLLAAFALWTAAICFVDVQPIGPQGSSVGFAALNRFFHNLTGVHLSLYTMTDWLSLIPLGLIAGFALLGLVQWIQRKSLLQVDHSILLLGGFYLVVMGAYVLFERIAVNYRPVLINGLLEASYPSSTTMLVICVMSTVMMQFDIRIKKGSFKTVLSFAIVAFIVFMVIGRLVSGVHWFTDIIGGILLSTGLVILYDAFCTG